MKIIQVSPLWTRVPPVKYGGAELIVSNLTEELVHRGHQVTLFASGDSKTKANLISVSQKSLFELKIPWDNRYYDSLAMSKAVEYAIKNKFDIIHDHLYDIGLTFSRICPIPMIHTTHGWPEPAKLPPGKKEILEEFKDQLFVAIAKHQQNKLPLNYIGTAYNGINITQFSFLAKPSNKIIWLGRFVIKKGAHIAIEVANKLKLPSEIAGKLDIFVPADIKYFNTFIKPKIKSGKTTYIGELGPWKKNVFLRHGKVFLNPIDWDEPFGLVVPEANACGTPVVAFARGSMPELIKDGYNGFLVKPGDVTAMAKAVRRIYDMPEEKYLKMRRNCRKHAEDNFTVERMVDDYEKIYQKVTQNWNKR